MMRCTTLKASGGRVTGLLAYYAGLAEDRARDGPGRGPVDYYVDPAEPPGRWWGHGRRALGVSGEVAGEDLRALLEARHPETGRSLGMAFGDRSARGFDATFSAPKSVSALWALSPDAFVRAEVLAAHDAAVDAAMGWFETHGAITRRGAGGLHQVDTHGVVAALFRQHTSRTADPQLHTHAVISSKVQDATGRWLALDARFLKQQQRTIGWIYDAALRAELTGRLGVTWEPALDGPSDMTCISGTVREALSRRSGQVEDKLFDLVRRWSLEHDGADPDPRTIAELERRAAIASRPAKATIGDPEALRADWVDTARRTGLDLDELRFQSLQRSRTAPALSDPGILDEALRRVSTEASTWMRADLARHIATLLPPDATHTAAEHVERIDQLATEAETRCIPLNIDPPEPATHRRDGRPTSEHVTDRRFTTPDVLEQELQLQHWAQTRVREQNPAPFDRGVAAAKAIAGTDRLVLVVGPAGTGKTRAVAQAARDLRDQGRPVLGLAPSGKAADVLALEVGCPAITLASLLTRHRDTTAPFLPSGATVIVDEAGMASTNDLSRLAGLADRHDWRVVLVGDPEQLPSVERGGVFAHLCETLPHHELATPGRFHEPWEADASIVLRAGNPDAAHAYADHGRLHSMHPALVPDTIARIHDRHHSAGRSIAITTGTADTARQINQAIQRNTPWRGVEVPLHDGTAVRVGDQIATRRNDPSLRTGRDAEVRNRHTWTVAGINRDRSLVAHHPDRGDVLLPGDYVQRHVELGWAVTGYGNQGDTVDIGLAILEPGTTRNHAYVALTRGRQTNVAWIPDPTGALDATDALSAIITHGTDRTSALAQRDRLHERAGLGREEPALAIDPHSRDLASTLARLDRLEHAHLEPPGLELER